MSKRSAPLRALRLAALSAMNFWIIIPQLPMDMSTRSASTALAIRLAWAIIEKKLNSMWFSVTMHDQSRTRDGAADAKKTSTAKGRKRRSPRLGFEANNATRELFFQDFF